LAKASGTVFIEPPQLIVFPFVSSIATFIVLTYFTVLMFGLGVMDGLSGGAAGALTV
jgi:hypothetical protein